MNIKSKILQILLINKGLIFTAFTLQRDKQDGMDIRLDAFLNFLIENKVLMRSLIKIISKER
jgi:hypothetical protein